MHDGAKVQGCNVEIILTTSFHPSLVSSPAQPLHPVGSLSKLELEGLLLVESTFRSTSCRGPSLSGSVDMSDAH